MPLLALASALGSRTRVLLGLAIGCLVVGSSDGAWAFNGDLSSPDAAVRSNARAPKRSFLDVALPLSFRIRLDGSYTRNRYASDDLSSLRIARFGPAISSPIALESRFSLTHGVGIEGLEVGIAWNSRSRLSDLGGFDVGRQFVGALIQFSH
jgi:hypothetical protein